MYKKASTPKVNSWTFGVACINSNKKANSDRYSIKYRMFTPSFLNLNFKDVFSYNPLVGIILSAIVIDILLFTLNIKRFRPYTFLKTNRYFSLIVLYTVILFTIFRNIPVFPFTLLAPWLFKKIHLRHTVSERIPILVSKFTA